MRFTRTALAGVWAIEPDRIADERGYFARTWDPAAFEAHGLDPRLAQCSISQNARKGTLRGLHLQQAPHEEAKLVRCPRGAIFDVAVDLRPGSPTYTHWVAATLDADEGRMLYIPPGCAHGFLTLADDTEVHYQISARFEPAASTGVRWDDPVFGIRWPAAPLVISARDAGYPDFAT